MTVLVSPTFPPSIPSTSPSMYRPVPSMTSTLSPLAASGSFSPFPPSAVARYPTILTLHASPVVSTCVSSVYGSSFAYRSVRSRMAASNRAWSKGLRLYVPFRPVYGFSFPSISFHEISGQTSHFTTTSRSSPGTNPSARASAGVTSVGLPTGSRS